MMQKKGGKKIFVFQAAFIISHHLWFISWIMIRKHQFQSLIGRLKKLALKSAKLRDFRTFGPIWWTQLMRNKIQIYWSNQSGSKVNLFEQNPFSNWGVIFLCVCTQNQKSNVLPQICYMKYIFLWKNKAVSAMTCAVLCVKFK